MNCNSSNHVHLITYMENDSLNEIKEIMITEILNFGVFKFNTIH